MTCIAFWLTSLINLAPSRKLRKPYPQHWYDLSIGRSECGISLTINSQKKELGCEIYIADSKETYFSFNENKDEIEKEIKGLQWMELPTKKASRIKMASKGNMKHIASMGKAGHKYMGGPGGKRKRPKMR